MYRITSRNLEADFKDSVENGGLQTQATFCESRDMYMYGRQY